MGKKKDAKALKELVDSLEEEARLVAKQEAATEGDGEDGAMDRVWADEINDTQTKTDLLDALACTVMVLAKRAGFSETAHAAFDAWYEQEAA